MPNTPGEHLQFHAVIHGWVQGVGFRDFTRRSALLLSLVGWVRNLPDGTVEVDAEGERKALDRLSDLLRQGFPSASVSEVVVEWREKDGGLEGFEIR